MAAEDRRNRNEHIKEALDPLDLRPRIDRYAREGLASIDPDDLNIRFRWWGLYTQRPASDGHFMLRIRIPGGALTSDQLAAIGRLAQVHGRNRLSWPKRIELDVWYVDHRSLGLDLKILLRTAPLLFRPGPIYGDAQGDWGEREPS